jgi:hypothetical protein
MIKAVVILAASLILAGCVGSKAAISDINDSMVKVRGLRGVTPDAEIDAEATRGCNMYTDKKAVKLSRYCVDSQCQFEDTLYSCADKDAPGTP